MMYFNDKNLCVDSILQALLFIHVLIQKNYADVLSLFLKTHFAKIYFHKFGKTWQYFVLSRYM